MTHFERFKRKRLGDILVDEGVVTRDAMIAALNEQQETQRLLSDILLDGRAVTDYDLARVQVQQAQLPFLDIEGYSFHKDLIESLPAAVLHEAGVIPLDRFGQTIVFACQEVPNAQVVERLKPHAKKGMHFYIAFGTSLRRKLRELAPLEEAAAKPAAAPKAAAASKAAAAEDEAGDDEAWKDLFDAANEAILADITNEDD